MKDPKENTSMTYIKSQIVSVTKVRDDFNADQIKFIKNLVNSDLTDNELYLFLGYANSCQLNPFNKEIIAVVYGGDTKYRRVNTIVTRDGKRVVAMRTGELDAIETKAIYTKLDKDGFTVQCEPWEGKLWGAMCKVTRKGKVFESTVPLSEYNTNQNVWASKPSTMIKKVAESQALSQAFPEVLGGVYDEAEMPTAEVIVNNPTEPATEAQLETLRVLGADMNQEYTKEQAARGISMMTQKGAK